jgi:hypothetical protein
MGIVALSRYPSIDIEKVHSRLHSAWSWRER